jgi:hypothetical protein
MNKGYARFRRETTNYNYPDFPTRPEVRLVFNRDETFEYLNKWFSPNTSQEFFNWIRFGQKGSTRDEMGYTAENIPTGVMQLWIMMAD